MAFFFLFKCLLLNGYSNQIKNRKSFFRQNEESVIPEIHIFSTFHFLLTKLWLCVVLMLLCHTLKWIVPA